MSKNKYPIRNLHDLQARMLGLKIEYTMQEVILKEDVKVYVKQFTPGHLIKRFLTPSSLIKADDKLNISSSVMSFLLPVLMNSTIFRGSGFITKTLVGLATSKVGKTLDADSLSSIFNTVKGFFTSKKKKQRSNAYVDYGIPPDSETF